LSHPDESTREKLTPYFARTDALVYAHERAMLFAQDARRQLEPLPNTGAKRILADIADFAVQRSF
jgi:geranylgeranyl pyrophosphate synthase